MTVAPTEMLEVITEWGIAYAAHRSRQSRLMALSEDQLSRNCPIR